MSKFDLPTGKPILSKFHRPLMNLEPATVDKPRDQTAADLSRFTTVTPTASSICLDTDLSLRTLDALGVRVLRMYGASAIDVIRNVAASREVLDGKTDAMLFIDSDIAFSPSDAIKLLQRPEPVVAGVYAKKHVGGQMAVNFGPGTTDVVYGANAPRLYPVMGAATGFLRIKIDFLKRMIRELKLPFCCSDCDGWFWPFFQPLIVEVDGVLKYRAEDYAFSHRCSLMGEPVLVDTSFRIGHIGSYAYFIEDAVGHQVQRHMNVACEFLAGPPPLMPVLPPDLADLVVTA